jgi:hypothetical protein
MGLFLGFIPHVFFADQAAQLIGWPTGSPFEFEVGFHDGGWGLLGLLCLWIGGRFWLATGLGWSFFMLGATYIHIVHTVREGNIQLSDHVFGRLHSGLAVNPAVPLSPLGGLSQPGVAS